MRLSKSVRVFASHCCLLAYLEVFAHLNKLSVSVDVAHSRSLCELYVETNP